MDGFTTSTKVATLNLRVPGPSSLAGRVGIRRNKISLDLRRSVGLLAKWLRHPPPISRFVVAEDSRFKSWVGRFYSFCHYLPPGLQIRGDLFGSCLTTHPSRRRLLFTVFVLRTPLSMVKGPPFLPGRRRSGRKPLFMEKRSSVYFIATVTGMGLLTDVCLL